MTYYYGTVLIGTMIGLSKQAVSDEIEANPNDWIIIKSERRINFNDGQPNHFDFEVVHLCPEPNPGRDHDGWLVWVTNLRIYPPTKPSTPKPSKGFALFARTHL